MATTTTYSLEKPTVGGSENTWGTDWNNNADKIDDLLDGTTAIKPNLDEGLWEVGGVAVTATAAELNILDGATVTTAELNILDGVTATTAELNILDGVTANAGQINQLNGNNFSTMGVTGGVSVSGNIHAATANVTGTGFVLSGDGDIVDLNTGYAAMRFSNGVQIYSANKGGSPVTTLGSNGVIESTIRATVTKTGNSAEYYGVRAWVRVAGDGIVGAVNISSYNTGNDTVYFTTAAPSANYAVITDSPARGGTYADNISTGSFRVQPWSSGGNFIDPQNFQAIVCW
jgi:hypothetical protein